MLQGTRTRIDANISGQIMEKYSINFYIDRNNFISNLNSIWESGFHSPRKLEREKRNIRYENIFASLQFINI